MNANALSERDVSSVEKLLSTSQQLLAFIREKKVQRLENQRRQQACDVTPARVNDEEEDLTLPRTPSVSHGRDLARHGGPSSSSSSSPAVGSPQLSVEHRLWAEFSSVLWRIDGTQKIHLVSYMTSEPCVLLADVARGLLDYVKGVFNTTPKRRRLEALAHLAADHIIYVLKKLCSRRKCIAMLGNDMALGSALHSAVCAYVVEEQHLLWMSQVYVCFCDEASSREEKKESMPHSYVLAASDILRCMYHCCEQSETCAMEALNAEPVACVSYLFYGIRLRILRGKLLRPHELDEAAATGEASAGGASVRAGESPRRGSSKSSAAAPSRYFHYIRYSRRRHRQRHVEGPLSSMCTAARKNYSHDDLDGNDATPSGGQVTASTAGSSSSAAASSSTMSQRELANWIADGRQNCYDAVMRLALDIVVECVRVAKAPHHWAVVSTISSFLTLCARSMQDASCGGDILGEADSTAQLVSMYENVLTILELILAMMQTIGVASSAEVTGGGIRGSEQSEAPPPPVDTEAVQELRECFLVELVKCGLAAQIQTIVYAAPHIVRSDRALFSLLELLCGLDHTFSVTSLTSCTAAGDGAESCHVIASSQKAQTSDMAGTPSNASFQSGSIGTPKAIKKALTHSKAALPEGVGSVPAREENFATSFFKSFFVRKQPAQHKSYGGGGTSTVCSSLANSVTASALIIHGHHANGELQWMEVPSYVVLVREVVDVVLHIFTDSALSLEPRVLAASLLSSTSLADDETFESFQGRIAMRGVLTVLQEQLAQLHNSRVAPQEVPRRVAFIGQLLAFFEKAYHEIGVSPLTSEAVGIVELPLYFLSTDLSGTAAVAPAQMLEQYFSLVLLLWATALTGAQCDDDLDRRSMEVLEAVFERALQRSTLPRDSGSRCRSAASSPMLPQLRQRQAVVHAIGESDVEAGIVAEALLTESESPFSGARGTLAAPRVSECVGTITTLSTIGTTLLHRNPKLLTPTALRTMFAMFGNHDGCLTTLGKECVTATFDVPEAYGALAKVIGDGDSALVSSLLNLLSTYLAGSHLAHDARHARRVWLADKGCIAAVIASIERYLTTDRFSQGSVRVIPELFHLLSVFEPSQALPPQLSETNFCQMMRECIPRIEGIENFIIVAQAVFDAATCHYAIKKTAQNYELSVMGSFHVSSKNCAAVKTVFLDAIPALADYASARDPALYQNLIDVLTRVVQCTTNIRSDILVAFVLENRLSRLLPYLELTPAILDQLPFAGTPQELKQFWYPVLVKAPLRSELRFTMTGGVVLTVGQWPERGFSLAAYLKFDAVYSTIPLFEFLGHDDTSLVDKSIAIEVVGGDSVQRSFDGRRVTINESHGLQNFTAGKWLHVCVVHSVAHRLSMYINGFFIGSCEMPYFSPGSEAVVRIGLVDRVVNEALFSVGEVIVWEEELTGAQVSANMATAETPASPPKILVHHIAQALTKTPAKEPIDDRVARYVPHEHTDRMLHNLLHRSSRIPLMAKIVGRHAAPPKLWVDYHLLWATRGGIPHMIRWLLEATTSEELHDMVQLLAEGIRRMVILATMDPRTYLLLGHTLKHQAQLISPEVCDSLMRMGTSHIYIVDVEHHVVINRLLFEYVLSDISLLAEMPLASAMYLIERMKNVFSVSVSRYAKHNATFVVASRFVERLLNTLVNEAPSICLPLRAAVVECAKQVLLASDIEEAVLQVFVSMIALLTPIEQMTPSRYNLSITATVPTVPHTRTDMPFRTAVHLCTLLLRALVECSTNTLFTSVFPRIADLSWYITCIGRFADPVGVVYATSLFLEAVMHSPALREDVANHQAMLVEALQPHAVNEDLVFLLMSITLGASKRLDLLSQRYSIQQQLDSILTVHSPEPNPVVSPIYVKVFTEHLHSATHRQLYGARLTCSVLSRQQSLSYRVRKYFSLARVCSRMMLLINLSRYKRTAYKLLSAKLIAEKNEAAAKVAEEELFVPLAHDELPPVMSASQTSLVQDLPDGASGVARVRSSKYKRAFAALRVCVLLWLPLQGSRCNWIFRAHTDADMAEHHSGTLFALRAMRHCATQPSLLYTLVASPLQTAALSSLVNYMSTAKLDGYIDDWKAQLQETYPIPLRDWAQASPKDSFTLPQVDPLDSVIPVTPPVSVVLAELTRSFAGGDRQLQQETPRRPPSPALSQQSYYEGVSQTSMPNPRERPGSSAGHSARRYSEDRSDSPAEVDCTTLPSQRLRERLAHISVSSTSSGGAIAPAQEVLEVPRFSNDASPLEPSGVLESTHTSLRTNDEGDGDVDGIDQQHKHQHRRESDGADSALIETVDAENADAHLPQGQTPLGLDETLNGSEKQQQQQHSDYDEDDNTSVGSLPSQGDLSASNISVTQPNARSSNDDLAATLTGMENVAHTLYKESLDQVVERIGEFVRTEAVAVLQTLIHTSLHVLPMPLWVGGKAYGSCGGLLFQMLVVTSSASHGGDTSANLIRYFLYNVASQVEEDAAHVAEQQQQGGGSPHLAATVNSLNNITINSTTTTTAATSSTFLASSQRSATAAVSSDVFYFNVSHFTEMVVDMISINVMDLPTANCFFLSLLSASQHWPVRYTEQLHSQVMRSCIAVLNKPSTLEATVPLIQSIYTLVKLVVRPDWVMRGFIECMFRVLYRVYTSFPPVWMSEEDGKRRRDYITLILQHIVCTYINSKELHKALQVRTLTQRFSLYDPLVYALGRTDEADACRLFESYCSENASLMETLMSGRPKAKADEALKASISIRGDYIKRIKSFNHSYCALADVPHGQHHTDVRHSYLSRFSSYVATIPVIEASHLHWLIGSISGSSVMKFNEAAQHSYHYFDSQRNYARFLMSNDLSQEAAHSDVLRATLCEEQVSHIGVLVPPLAVRCCPAPSGSIGINTVSVDPSIKLKPSALSLLRYLLDPHETLRFISNAFRISGIHTTPCLVLLTTTALKVISCSYVTQEGDIVLCKYDTDYNKEELSDSGIESGSSSPNASMSAAKTGKRKKPFALATMTKHLQRMLGDDRSRKQEQLQRDGTRVAQSVQQSTSHTYHHLYWTYTVSSIREVRCLRYMHLDTAVSLSMLHDDGPMLSIVDATQSMNPAARASFIKVLKEVTSAQRCVFLDDTKRGTNLRMMLVRWAAGSVSNYDYLHHLNFAAGRTFKDFNQYPIFPWVLADYMSKSLDLENPDSFRDFMYPMGAQTEARQRMVHQLYNDTAEMWKQVQEDDPSGKASHAFHHGTHYSTSGGVLYYLIRVEPFSTFAKVFQGGEFDIPARLFDSLAASYLSCVTGPADCKELVPEFYFNTKFLRNSNELNLGVKPDGDAVGDVKLPPWAKGSTQVFTAVMRYALESEYVVEHIHSWIDLVFGVCRRGQLALEHFNIFQRMTYGEEVSKALQEAITTHDCDVIISEVDNFGQTPMQLFQERHPAHKELEPVKAAAAHSPASTTPAGVSGSGSGGASTSPASLIFASLSNVASLATAAATSSSPPAPASGQTYTLAFEKESPRVMRMMLHAMDAPQTWFQLSPPPSAFPFHTIPNDVLGYFQGSDSAVLGLETLRSGKLVRRFRRLRPVGDADYFVCWHERENRLMRFDSVTGAFLSSIYFDAPCVSGLRITAMHISPRETLVMVAVSSGALYCLYPDTTSGTLLLGATLCYHVNPVVGLTVDPRFGRAISYTRSPDDYPIIWRVQRFHTSKLFTLNMAALLPDDSDTNEVPDRVVVHACIDRISAYSVLLTKRSLLIFDNNGEPFGAGTLPMPPRVPIGAEDTVLLEDETGEIGVPVVAPVPFMASMTAVAVYQTHEWASGVQLYITGHQDGSVAMWRSMRLPPDTVRPGRIAVVEFHSLLFDGSRVGDGTYGAVTAIQQHDDKAEVPSFWIGFMSGNAKLLTFDQPPPVAAAGTETTGSKGKQ